MVTLLGKMHPTIKLQMIGYYLDCTEFFMSTSAEETKHGTNQFSLFLFDQNYLSSLVVRLNMEPRL